jgi:glutamyl-tRNA synthetase
MPVLAHMPLILAPGGGKLSKRHGATGMEEFRTQGYLPEAIMNYVALLGWSFDGTTEIFSQQDLLDKFDLARVSASPATFDYQKLQWFNQYYINHILDLDDLTARLVPFLAEAGMVDRAATDPAHPDYQRLRPAVALLKDRLETLAQGPELLSYFLEDELPPYDVELLIPKKVDPSVVRPALQAVEQVLDEVDLNDEAATEARFRALADEIGLKAGQLFMPIRVAVTGRTQSPGLFETLRVIGIDRVRRRLRYAIVLLGEPQG